MHPTPSRPAPIPDPETERLAGKPTPTHMEHESEQAQLRLRPRRQHTEKEQGTGTETTTGIGTGTATGAGAETHKHLLSQVQQQHGRVPHAQHVEPQVHQGGGVPLGRVVDKPAQDQPTHGQAQAQAQARPQQHKTTTSEQTAETPEKQQEPLEQAQQQQQQQQQGAPPPIAVPVEKQAQLQHAQQGAGAGPGPGAGPGAGVGTGEEHEHSTHERQERQQASQTGHVYGQPAAAPQPQRQEQQHKGQLQQQQQQQQPPPSVSPERCRGQQAAALKHRLIQQGHVMAAQVRPYVARGRDMLSGVGQQAKHGWSSAKQQLTSVRPGSILHMKPHQVALSIFTLWASYTLLCRLFSGSAPTFKEREHDGAIQVQRSTYDVPVERDIPLWLSPIHVHPHIAREQSSTDMFAQRTGSGIGKEGTWDWFAHINEPIEMLMDNLQDRLDVTVKTPGMNKTDISIRLKDDVLVVSGRHIKQQCTPITPAAGTGTSVGSGSGSGSIGTPVTDQARCTTMETQFWRSLHLPSNIAQDQIKAEYDDKRGLIHIHMPKLPFDPHRPRQIHVQ